MIQLPTAPHLMKSKCDPSEEAFDIFRTRHFLSNRLIIQEKIEGYGLLFYFLNGKAVVRHKGKQVTYPLYRDGFKSWIKDKESIMSENIKDRLIIFGVWPKKGQYTNPPDLFLIHDVYDNKEKRFWNSERTERFCKILGISSVPKITETCCDINGIMEKSKLKSKFGVDAVGSVYLRYEDEWRVLDRAQFCNSTNQKGDR